MGIRLASVRHTDVVVMAPALTETAQTKSFSFVTSPSRSPSLSLKNHTKKSQKILREGLQPKFSNGHKPAAGMNGHSPNNKKTYSINGLAKNLKNEFLPLDKKSEDTSFKEKITANYSTNPIGSCMMNSGFLEDPEMGLQKSSKDICGSEKKSDDEKIFKTFDNIITNEALNSNPSLPQNVDEIFKVLSNLDSNPNDIESGTSGDIETIFDNGLFNDADIINMCVDESLVAGNKDTIICDKIEEIRKKKFQIMRKCEFLMRRLRKFSARTIGKHTAEEITGVLEYSSNLLEASNRVRDSAGKSELKCDVKPVSHLSMYNFMKQLEHAVTQQTNTVARNKTVRNCKYFGSGSSTSNLISTSNGVRSALPGSVLPPYPLKLKKDLATLSGELITQLSNIQQEIDSDATESSSGCESCDEFISYNNAHQHPLSIGKRASWRWAEERSMIAAKWTWLQSQVADLEYRIRQHNELKKNARATKGALKFVKDQESLLSLPNGYNSDKESSCSRVRGLVKQSFTKRKILHLAGIHRTSKKASRVSSLRCSCRTSIPGCGVCTGRAEPGQPAEPISTLPINHRVAFLDPGFHPHISFPNDVSASLHYNAVMKCADWQSRASRIQGSKSSLPPTTASTEEKNRLMPPAPDHQIVDLQRSKAAALAVSVNNLQKFKRKLGRRKGRRKSALLGLDRYRHKRKLSAGLGGTDVEDQGIDKEVESSNSCKFLSPVPSPASSSQAATPLVLKDNKEQPPLNKRKRENSYDIDNIVIPYSIASATRLEKLNYKEILTPKWRHVPKSSDDLEQKNGIIRRSSHENMEMEEDNSDEAHIARHERCQIEEKKKFLSYLKLPGGLRGRAQRRTDSRADSSDPNTPDGMSPRDDGSGLTDDLPGITSPPLSSTNCDNENPSGRRRTTSNSQTAPVLPEVPPYEPRKFPLSDEVYKAMLAENEDHQHPPVMNSSYQDNVCVPASPGSVSTDSADSFLGEDPNDPEWTTHSTTERSNCKR